MDRVLEPELMDTPKEAEDYDLMDHSQPNAAFVERLVELGARGRMLDIGTGPAHIPLAVCARDQEAVIVAADAAESMLAVAKKNVASSAFGPRIRLELQDAKNLGFPDASFDVVFSNSILHHLADPRPFLREAWRVLVPGGVLLVRDLFRPDTPKQVERLVDHYAAGATPAQRALFAASLHAALTPDELRDLVAELGLSSRLEVVIDSDRHMSLQTPRRKERPRLTLARPSPRELRAEEDREAKGFERARPGPLPAAPVLRPTRWSRRRGAATTEAQKLEALLSRAERLIFRGQSREQALRVLASLPKGPYLEPLFHLRAGDAFLDVADLEGAERHFRSVLERESTSADAWYGLGLVEAERGRFDRMVERWQKVRSLDLEAPRPSWALSEEEFAAVADAAFDSLPGVVRSKLQNLPLVVTDYPAAGLIAEGIDPRVLGLITGVPLPEKRLVMDSPPELDCVQLYQRNIERVSFTPEQMRDEIRVTVLHETGHYFGLDEEQLAKLGLD